MICEVLLLLLVLLLIYVAVKNGFENENYFRDRNIKSMESNFALGATGRVFMGRENMFDYLIRAYNKFSEERY